MARTVAALLAVAGGASGCFDLDSLKQLYRDDGGARDLGVGGGDGGGDDGGGTAECALGSADCTGDNVPRHCEGGKWKTGDRCGGATPICSNGACTAVCMNGDLDCLGDVPRVCGAGAWHPQSQCAAPTPHCVSGKCVECYDGDLSCDGANTRQCQNGHWQVVSQCSGATPVCSGGSCVACRSGTSDCQGATPRQCVNEQWQAGTACSGASPVCWQGQCGECQTGAADCAGTNGATARTCVDRHWQNSADCSGTAQYCGAGACHACATGTANCNGNSADGCEQTLITCYKDADHDGYPASGSSPMIVCYSCPSGWRSDIAAGTPGDCDDNDADVHPGQTRFFSSPDKAGNYDYDCSGHVEHEFPRTNLNNDCTRDTGVVMWFVQLPGCGNSAQLLLCNGCDSTLPNNKCSYEDYPMSNSPTPDRCH